MAQLPGGSASDFWWLKPQPADDPLPAIRMGMQNAHQQRLDKIALAEHAYKAQVREEISMGAAELSRVIAENFKSGDISSPESQSRIWEVGTKYPTLLSSTVWKEYGDMMQNQEQIKLRKFQTESLNIYRTQQLDIAQQRADTATQRAETLELSAQDKLELDMANLELKRERNKSLNEYDQAKINASLATIEAVKLRGEIAMGNLKARIEELEVSKRRLDERLPAPVKERLTAARAKFNNFGFSTKFSENAKAYIEEVNALLTPHDVAPTASATPSSAAPNEDGSREKPFKPASPSDAAKYPKGTWFLTPDGRLIQRQ